MTYVSVDERHGATAFSTFLFGILRGLKDLTRPSQHSTECYKRRGAVFPFLIKRPFPNRVSISNVTNAVVPCSRTGILCTWCIEQLPGKAETIARDNIAQSLLRSCPSLLSITSSLSITPFFSPYPLPTTLLSLSTSPCPPSPATFLTTHRPVPPSILLLREHLRLPLFLCLDLPLRFRPSRLLHLCLQTQLLILPDQSRSHAMCAHPKRRTCSSNRAAIYASALVAR
jgi:hypothetical protein